jgi:plastocyanin
MRVSLLAAGLVVLKASAASSPAVDLRGTAHTGDRPQSNAVVWLEAPNAAPGRETRRPILDQRNLSFSPHVLAVRVGASVDFPNNDRVFHNVFSFRDGKKFDLGLYPVGVQKPVVFDKPGLSRIFCNIHPNMAAYVFAVDSPYFGVTDERGAFAIALVPSGTFKYHAWRPGGPELTGTVTIDTGQPLDIHWR